VRYSGLIPAQGKRPEPLGGEPAENRVGRTATSPRTQVNRRSCSSISAGLRAYPAKIDDPIAVNNFGYFNAQGNLSKCTNSGISLSRTIDLWMSPGLGNCCGPARRCAVRPRHRCTGCFHLPAILLRTSSRVVGWYEYAAIHRKEAYSYRGNLTVGSSITARAEDAFVLPVAIAALRFRHHNAREDWPKPALVWRRHPEKSA
jgi:hypothetical protein